MTATAARRIGKVKIYEQNNGGNQIGGRRAGDYLATRW